MVLVYYRAESILHRDYPVVLGTLFLFTLLGLIAKLLTDISYAFVDPRIGFTSVRAKGMINKTNKYSLFGIDLNQIEGIYIVYISLVLFYFVFICRSDK